MAISRQGIGSGEGLKRFEISADIQTKVTAHLEFETYYVHQFANGKNVKALDAMGFTLKFYFKYKEAKRNLQKRRRHNLAFKIVTPTRSVPRS